VHGWSGDFHGNEMKARADQEINAKSFPFARLSRRTDKVGRAFSFRKSRTRWNLWNAFERNIRVIRIHSQVMQKANEKPEILLLSREFCDIFFA
jgi:hypothetical protein